MTKDMPSLQPVWLVYFTNTTWPDCFDPLAANIVMKETRKPNRLHQKKNFSVVGKSLGAQHTNKVPKMRNRR
jgi:hypothetical protein